MKHITDIRYYPSGTALMLGKELQWVNQNFNSLVGKKYLNKKHHTGIKLILTLLEGVKLLENMK